MQRMRRTQIYLDPDLADALDCLARQSGTSRAELIRLAARRFIEGENPVGQDPVLGLIGIGRGGPGRVSEGHDELLAEHSLEYRSR